MINGLNAAWACWTVDILAVVVILGFATLATKRGFIDCLFSLIATVVAFVTALLLLRSVLRWTDGLFGLQTLLEEACIKGFSKVKAFNVDISNAGLQASLEEHHFPSFMAKFIVESVGNSSLADGTTIAMVIGAPIGRFATSLIAFFVLFIIFRLVIGLIKHILSSAANKTPIISGTNRLLGFFVGIIQGVLLISSITSVLSVIPVDGINTFFDQCLLLKLLYNYNPINVILGWVLV